MFENWIKKSLAKDENRWKKLQEKGKTKYDFPSFVKHIDKIFVFELYLISLVTTILIGVGSVLDKTLTFTGVVGCCTIIFFVWCVNFLMTSYILARWKILENNR